MENPACSTMEICEMKIENDTPSTSMYESGAVLEHQCYHNEGVVVDDEDVEREDTAVIDEATEAEGGYTNELMAIIQSSPKEGSSDSGGVVDMDEAAVKIEATDEFRTASDAESCSSVCSSWSTSDNYIKRKRSCFLEELEEQDCKPFIKTSNIELTEDDVASSKKIKLEDTASCSSNSIHRSSIHRDVFPSKEFPPCGMNKWLQQFKSWSHAERLVVLNYLIDVCEPTQVRHMMQIIEPQFQRDFLSLLPKELALHVLRYLDPSDILRAAQTCRYWKTLTDDNVLWREKCAEAHVDPDTATLSAALYQRKNRHRPAANTSPWKLAYLRKQTIESNWRVNSVRSSKILRGHDDHVITCLQFCGNRIVSGSDDNTLKVWSVSTGKCLRTLVGHTGGVWSSQMSGNVIISGSTDRTLKVWNAETGMCVHTLHGHTSTVRCMHLHGQTVVSGSRDATLRVWDIGTGECSHVLVGHLAAVRCVQYDGRLVVSGAYDYTVKVWDPATEICLHTLSGHTNRVYSLQFDGVHVVSGSLDTSIKVWDVETGALKHTLMGHQSLTSGMELRNNILVSGNADSTVKVWDIISGKCLQTLSGSHKHQSAVTCLQFNTSFVITSSDDGTVKLWDVKTGEFIRNLVTLESGGSGGVVWRIRASETKLVCAVGSRNGTEETKLLVLDFDIDPKYGSAGATATEFQSRATGLPTRPVFVSVAAIGSVASGTVPLPTKKLHK